LKCVNVGKDEWVEGWRLGLFFLLGGGGGMGQYCGIVEKKSNGCFFIYKI